MRFLFVGLWSSFVFFQPANAGMEAFDQFRASLNEKWYEAIIEPCKDWPSYARPEELQNFLKKKGYCENGVSEQTKSLKELSNEMQEKIFFDAVAEDMAKNNQCSMQTWANLSVQSPVNTSQFAKANQQLEKSHPILKGDLEKREAYPSNVDQAKVAQRALVTKYVQVAEQIVEKERNLEKLRLVKMGKEERNDQIQALARQIEVLRNTIPWVENNSAREFFKNQIYENIRYRAYTAKAGVNSDLIEKSLGQGPQSFQKLVVEKSLEEKFENQKRLADMKASYKDQHAFKVKVFEENHAQSFIHGTGAQSDHGEFFSHMSCSLESKYGIGSDISSLSNNLVVAIATAGVGTVAFAVGKAAQAGLISRNIQTVVDVATTASFGSVAVAEMSYAMISSCFDRPAAVPKFSACEMQKDIDKAGVQAVVEQNLQDGDCVLSIGLAALSGTLALKNAIKARDLKFTNHLNEIGYSQAYNNTLSRIQKSSISEAYKKDIEGELKKALSSVKKDGAPNPQLIEAMSVEDPDGLYRLLKQVNETAKPTWAERVRAWLKGQKISVEEQLELETCLIQNPMDRAQSCVFNTNYKNEI